MSTPEVVWHDLMSNGKSALAEAKYEAACDSLQSATDVLDAMDENDERALQTWTLLAMAQLGAGRHMDGALSYDRSLALAEQKWGRHDVRLVPILKGFSECLLATMEWESAEALLSRCLSIATDYDTSAQKYVPSVLNSLANVYTKLRNIDRALWVYGKLIPMVERTDPQSAELASLIEKRSNLEKLQEKKFSTTGSLKKPDMTAGSSGVGTTGGNPPVTIRKNDSLSTSGSFRKPELPTPPQKAKPVTPAPKAEKTKSAEKNKKGGLFSWFGKKDSKDPGDNGTIDGVDVRSLLDDPGERQKMEKYREGKRTDQDAPALFDIGASILSTKYDEILDEIGGASNPPAGQNKKASIVPEAAKKASIAPEMQSKKDSMLPNETKSPSIPGVKTRTPGDLAITQTDIVRPSGSGFDRFEMLELVGTGGMGSVHKAKDRLTEKIMAVKLLNANLVGNENFLKRVTKEAVGASRMSHPNIVRVYDHGPCDNGQFYIAMEYVDGICWETEIDKSGPIEPKQCIEILKQICKALMYAHDMGVIHRDIKAENIMIMRTADGGLKVKVLDFGLAKYIAGAELGSHTLACTLTQEGAFLGSPLYVSPEQVRGQEIDTRSDIYSFGALAYYALTKHYPIDAPSIAEVLIAQLRKVPKPFASVCPNVKYPDGLEALVLKCLAKEAAGRPQKMLEIMTALDGMQ